MASNLKRKEAVVLEMANKAFTNVEELSQCMHASCLLPGIAGPLMNVDMNQIGTGTITTKTSTTPKFALGNNLQTRHPTMEPLADALVYKPIP